MNGRRPDDDMECGSGPGAFSFLRTLLSGIPWSEYAERVDTYTYSAPKSAVVRIKNANGRIGVRGEDRGDVQLEVTRRARAESREAAERLAEAIRVVHSGAPDTLELEVEVPRKWNRRGHANLDVRVPRGTRIECDAVNGKLAVCGLRAPLRARSSNGSVSVHDVMGDVEVFTSNAKVSCDCTCGRLVARSSNGKIELVEHRGSVDASTSNGLIHATLEDVGDEGILLATSNGRIVLELPDEVDADVDVRVDNGMIRTDRSLANQPREVPGRLRGTLGLGGIPIKIRTSNGSVSIR